jgi:antitoxin ParD1/3/4
MNVSLPDELKAFVEQQVTLGGFSSTSEYLRALIREARNREADRKLESLLLEGLESGAATPLTPEDWEGIRREALKRLKSRKPK